MHVSYESVLYWEGSTKEAGTVMTNTIQVGADLIDAIEALESGRAHLAGDLMRSMLVNLRASFTQGDVPTVMPIKGAA